MKEKIRRFVIVPDEVMQSRDLNNGAKFLLGFIMRLSNKRGYCWASNKYLANYFNVNRATIIRWVNELKECGYIKCNIKKTKRRIRINQKLLKNIHYCQANEAVASLKKSIRRMPQYKVWKKKVIERDEGKCRLCGITENQQIENNSSYIGFEAHHILPVSLLIDYYHITNKEEAKECKPLWEIGNGITLCNKCHRMKHGIRYWDILIDLDLRGYKNVTCKNATGRKNANIDNTTYYRGHIENAPTVKDDFEVETKEWTDKKGQIHGRDSIDYKS